MAACVVVPVAAIMPVFPAYQHHRETTTEYWYRTTYFYLSAESARLIHRGPTWTPPPSITCGTVQFFFLFLAPPCYFSFCSCFRLFLDFQLLPSNLVPANTILNFFAIFPPFLCKLNLLPTNSPLICRLCGQFLAPPYYLFIYGFCFLQIPTVSFFYEYKVYIYIPPMIPGFEPTHTRLRGGQFIH